VSTATPQSWAGSQCQAQAASPSLGAILIERFSASGTLAALFAVAITNVVLVGILFALLPRTTLSGSSA
jgi:hypothetical protein